MKKSELNKNNKLIAEFMDSDFAKRLPKIWDGTDTEGIDVSKCAALKIFMYLKDYERMRYDNSWDWLMPVVHKILFGTNSNNANSGKWADLTNNIQFALGNCEITNLFDTIVEFINWYNKNN